MKYNVGDKVTIRHDAIENRSYTMDDGARSNVINAYMMIYRGELATITKREWNYKIDLDGGCWNWTDNMFKDEPKYLIEY